MPVLDTHPKKKHPLPAIHLDEEPHSEVVTCAGRGSNNTTSAAPLKSLPSVTSIYNATGTSSPAGNGASAAAAASSANRAVASSASSTRSNISSRSVASTAASSTTSATSSALANGGVTREPRKARVVIVNEQTSHHPPISHFVAEARVSPDDGAAEGETKTRTVRLRGADQLSAKFTGANVRIVPGVHNKGLFLDLADGEEYRITHPTAAVAGLLRASPYATITDGTTITCTKPPAGASETGTKRLRAIVQYIEEVRFLLFRSCRQDLRD